MPSLGILFYNGPIQNETPETVIEIARAALKKGYRVRIFCFMDGVYATLKGRERIPKGMINVEEALKELISKGVQIVICTLTADQRGVKDVVEGVEKGGTPDLAEIVDEVDRFIIIR